MQTVLLVILIILALSLIAVVLVQRSEGGALGMGGGPGGLFSARGSANLLTRITAGLAAAFMVLSLILVILEGRSSHERSVLDRPGAAPSPIPTATSPATPAETPATEDTGERVPVGATESGTGETFNPGESKTPAPAKQEPAIPQTE